MTRVRVIIPGVLCLALGTVLLIPGGVRVFQSVAERVAPPRLQSLPDMQTDFVFSINAVAIDESAIIWLLPAIGVAFVTAGVVMLIRRSRE